MADPLAACIACRAGLHAECWEPPEVGCCCGAKVTLLEVHLALRAAEQDLVKEYAPDAVTDAGGLPPATGAIAAPEKPEPKRGISGYIHPDAWGSTADIGTLVDPESTGRKRVVKMYQISQGQVCEWAGKRGTFAGGPVPMVGCINNPATDWHHGPDKNTLNNAKRTYGVGDVENVHIICSECHNMLHALIDDTYPPFDRVADQARPWIPIYPEGWEPEPVTDASFEELMAEEKRRYDDRKRRGRKTRGRNSRARAGVDTTVGDDGEPGGDADGGAEAGD